MRRMDGVAQRKANASWPTALKNGSQEKEASQNVLIFAVILAVQTAYFLFITYLHLLYHCVSYSTLLAHAVFHHCISLLLKNAKIFNNLILVINRGLAYQHN